MRVRVLFFGQLKDLVGRAEESLEVPAGACLATVFEHYKARYPGMSALAGSIVLAHNRQFAPPATPLAENDEVGLLPPVSGGSGQYTHEMTDPAGHFFALTRGPIDWEALRKRVLRGEDGAVVIFDGVVRNNTKGRPTLFLEYDCYEGMAVKTMADIGLDIAARHDIGRIAMVHRLGRMDVGETSVAVVVGAPHRRPAFDAALEGINRLKRLVPIWKKEHFADGEVWVEGEWDESVLGR